MWRLFTLGLFAVLGVAHAADQGQGGENAESDANLPRWLFLLDDVNHALPEWLRFAGEYRSRTEAQTGIKFTSNKDLYLLSRFRFHTTIQPVRWLTFFGELQDARVVLNNQHISNTPAFQDTWDLRQAYVQVGTSKEGWLDLTVGRQVLAFGDERVIGPSDWTNTARTFDAVRLNLRHAGTHVSLFASSVVVEREGVIDHHLQGNNIYGAYASLQNLVRKATLEPYVLWRVAPSNPILTASSFPGSLSQVTTGVRLAGKLPGEFDYNIEMDRQTGSVGTRSIAAWAGYWSVGKTFRNAAATPRLFFESNYASGTEDLHGGTWSTYDEIYPSEHDKLGFADQIGRRNIRQLRTGVEETIGKWSLKEAYISFWLATVNDGLYTNTGIPFLPAVPSLAGRHVAQEIDLIAEYSVKRGVAAGFGYARIFPGSFLKVATPGRSYNYPFFYLTYRF